MVRCLEHLTRSSRWPGNPSICFGREGGTSPRIAPCEGTIPKPDDRWLSNQPSWAMLLEYGDFPALADPRSLSAGGAEVYVTRCFHHRQSGCLLRHPES